jgi:hypothetical protein
MIHMLLRCFFEIDTSESCDDILKFSTLSCVFSTQQWKFGISYFKFVKCFDYNGCEEQKKLIKKAVKEIVFVIVNSFLLLSF